MSSRFSRVMSAERAPLFVWTSVASLTTLTVSSSAPTSSVIARSATRSVAPMHDAFLFVALETLNVDGEVERSGEQVGKHERAVGAGHGLFDEIRADVLDGDGGARHHAAARVSDDARQMGGQALGIRTCGRSGDDHRQRKHRA